METRNINVIIKSPDKSHPLGIYTSSFDAGRCGDSGTTKLNFIRPDAYLGVNLRLVFQVGYNDAYNVDLGQSDVFTLTSAQTQATSFKLQVQFTNGDGIIAQSNKLTFYLTSSVSNKTCNTDWVQELLQFAISEKVSMTRIVPEYSAVDLSTQDNDAALIPTYYLKGFNHFGDLIMDVEIPFKEAVEYFSQALPITPGSVTAEDVSYDNTLVNPEESNTLPQRLTATEVQSALDELVTNLFDLKNSIPSDVTEVSTQIKDLQTQVSTINDQLETINSIDQIQNTDISNIRSDLVKSEASVSNLSEQLNTLSGSVSSQGTQLTSLTEAVGGLTTEVRTLRTDTARLEDSVKNLEDSQYELPIASPTTLGGVKIGANLTISEDGTLNAVGGDTPVPPYTLPQASKSSLGGVKVGNNLSISDDGTLSADDQSYELPTASSTMLGGIKIGTGLSIDNNGVVSTTGGSISLPIASSSVLGGVKIGSGISISEDGMISNDPYKLPIATNEVLGGIKLGSNLISDSEGKVSVDLGNLINQINTLSEQLSNTTQALSNLSTQVDSISAQLSQNTNNITALETSLSSKLDISGGTLTGATVAGGIQSDDIAQVRNIIVYPKGTDVSTIPVPPQGTVVMIKEE